MPSSKALRRVKCRTEHGNELHSHVLKNAVIHKPILKMGEKSSLNRTSCGNNQANHYLEGKTPEAQNSGVEVGTNEPIKT